MSIAQASISQETNAVGRIGNPSSNDAVERALR